MTASSGVWREVAAEFLGTFLLLGFGTAVVAQVVLSGGTHGSYLSINLGWGLAVTMGVYASAGVSGAHLNPAVTVAFAACRRFPRGEVLPYVAAQAVGAIVGASLLRVLFGAVGGLGATRPASSAWQALGLEAAMTAALMFVVAAVATDGRAVGSMAGVAIGAVVGLEAIFGGPISGASMNPARSLGPAVAALDGRFLWIYVLAPLVGAVAGAFAYEAVRVEEPRR